MATTHLSCFSSHNLFHTSIAEVLSKVDFLLFFSQDLPVWVHAIPFTWNVLLTSPALLLSLVKTLPIFQSCVNSPPPCSLHQSGGEFSLSAILRALICTIRGLLQLRLIFRSFLVLLNEPFLTNLESFKSRHCVRLISISR